MKTITRVAFFLCLMLLWTTPCLSMTLVQHATPLTQRVLRSLYTLVQDPINKPILAAAGLLTLLGVWHHRSLSHQEAQKKQRTQEFFKALHEGNYTPLEGIAARGLDTTICNEDGETPLIAAARIGHAPVVYTLCQQGADIYAQDKLGATALTLALYQAQDLPRHVRSLVAHSPTRDRTGIIAHQKNYLSIILELLRRGYQADNETIKNIYALQTAIERQFRDIESAPGGLTTLELNVKITMNNIIDHITDDTFLGHLATAITGCIFGKRSR